MTTRTNAKFCEMVGIGEDEYDREVMTCKEAHARVKLNGNGRPDVLGVGEVGVVAVDDSTKKREGRRNTRRRVPAFLDLVHFITGNVCL